MIYSKEVRNKKVGVLGFGYTGRAIVDSLLASGAEVFLHDDCGVKGGQYQKYVANLLDEDVVKSLDLIVMSPGIHLLWPAPHQAVLWAEKYGIDLIGDLDLFQRALKNSVRNFGEKKTSAKIIAITGTNGKSTTTALVQHILDFSQIKSSIGGNFGPPFLSLDDGRDYYVFEISSYQLEHAKILGFDTAILLNITPDHLTRHGGMSGYVAVKQKIFVNSERSIISLDDDYCVEIFKFLSEIKRKNLVSISGKFVPDGGVGWSGDFLIDDRFGKAEIVCEKHPNLDGTHNRQNIAAAYAACCDIVSRKNFVRYLYSFKCLEHRQEFVAKIDGVSYINDSKATNADSVEQALMRFDDIFWILGGRPKENGISSLEKYFSKIKMAFLIGETAEAWHAFLSSRGVVCEIAVTLEKAVKRAYEEVRKAKRANIEGTKTQRFCEKGEGREGSVESELREGSSTAPDVVLLSPACASFDQFKSFEERGEVFKNLVHELELGHELEMENLQ